MKKRIKFLALSFLFLSFSLFSYGQAHEIKVKIKGLSNVDVYLGFHFGYNKYIKDTAKVDNKGVAVFSSKEEIPGGIYLIITPDKNYFEIIVAEDKIYIETDTVDFVKNMKIINSEENKVFYSYLTFMDKQYQRNLELQKQLKAFESIKDSADAIKDRMRAFDKEISVYRNNVITQHPTFFFSKVLKAMDELTPREKLENEPDSVYSNFLYSYYQLHFFDNIDFSDARILRTPLYDPKIDKFLDKMTIRHPDSIRNAAVRLIDQTLVNKDVFKYTLIKVFNKYVDDKQMGKFMGMDAIVSKLIEKYYLNEKLTDWVDTASRKKYYDYYVKHMYNLIGMKAPELIMKDTSDAYHSLLATKSVYTVLVFWEPSCSHCRKEIPKLNKYIEKVPSDSVQVFSVYIGNNMKEWRDYLRENKLQFINVADPLNYNNFRTYYDISSTPVVYLIDKKKEIVAKRIEVEKIEQLINVLEGRLDKIKPDKEEESKQE